MSAATDIDEQDALDCLYRLARNRAVCRTDLLRTFTDVRLARPSDWDRRAVRAELEMLKPQWKGNQPKRGVLTLSADVCWCCGTGERRLYWHHVITVQNGGSSHPRNVVAICHACHRTVHPHLPEGDSMEQRDGFVRLGDYAKRWGWPRLGRKLTQAPVDAPEEG